MIQNDREYLRFHRLEQAFRMQGSTQDSARLKGMMLEYDKRTGALERVGSWMPTYSGRRFWLLDPRPEDIETKDIARGLSRLPRWLGATKGRPFLVAQHLVLCSYLVPAPYRLASLMHDAPEVYTGDLVSPIKHLVATLFKPIEHRIMLAIAKRYGFRWNEEVEAVVKQRADIPMLLREADDLLPHQVLRDRPMVKSATGIGDLLTPWTRRDAKRHFLNRLRELTGGKEG